jgi:hypothetical protein
LVLGSDRTLKLKRSSRFRTLGPSVRHMAVGTNGGIYHCK